MNQKYQLLHESLLIILEGPIFGLFEKLHKYIFKPSEKEIGLLKDQLNNPNLDSQKKAELQKQLEILEKSVGIGGVTILSASILGLVGLSALFYYRWKVQEKELEKRFISEEQKKQAKKQFAQKFITQLDQTKNQVNISMPKTKDKIIKNIDKAKQHILKKINK
jgi:uncharacterized protein HemX